MKERLTGAIILVALIVLLVPELLTGPIRTKAAAALSPAAGSAPILNAARTAREEPALHTYTLTLDGSPAIDTPATPAAQALVRAAETPEENSPQSPAQALPEESSEPQTRGSRIAATHADAAQVSTRSGEAESGLQVAKSPAHRSGSEGRSSGSSGGWVVQLGSFASRQNADRLARSLESRGFRMSVSPARAGSRLLWRVRAGPAHGRTGAQHLAARLRALGHGGELLPIR